MQFMLIRKGALRATPALAAFHERLAAAGVFGMAVELAPAAEGARLRLWPGGEAVAYGPFDEAPELLSGFTVIQAASRAEALEWAAQWPAGEGAHVVEVRETGCPGGCAGVPLAAGPADRRFVVLLRSGELTEADGIPPQSMLDDLNAFNAREAAAGTLLAGDGLKSTARGARVRLGAPAAVMDGPFAEAKELIAGFWMARAPSLEAALEWARTVPYPTGPCVEVEIREALPLLSPREASAERQLRAEQLDAALRAELAGR
jgi:hypothetical protein